jgi:hypothetical protein
MPDLGQIAEFISIPLRKLRYVLDHGMLPGGAVASRGRGAVRSFTTFEAFGIVTAALMLQAGLKRALVRQGLAALCEGSSRHVATIPLYQAFTTAGAAHMELADWTFVRICGLCRRPGAVCDTTWIPLAGDKPPAKDYEPLVTITINLSQISRKLRPLG